MTDTECFGTACSHLLPLYAMKLQVVVVPDSKRCARERVESAAT